MRQGGAIAGFIYRKVDEPQYVVGHGTLVGMISMSLILQIFMTFYLRRENKRRDREYKPLSEYTMEEKLAEQHKGDNATFFRYTV
jgi:hypothetical protein